MLIFTRRAVRIDRHPGLFTDDQPKWDVPQIADEPVRVFLERKCFYLFKLKILVNVWRLLNAFNIFFQLVSDSILNIISKIDTNRLSAVNPYSLLLKGDLQPMENQSKKKIILTCALQILKMKVQNDFQKFCNNLLIRYNIWGGTGVFMKNPPYTATTAQTGYNQLAAYNPTQR